MAEIPFCIAGSLRWISGVSDTTTCRDVLVALVRAETKLPCTPHSIHQQFALVETWRQVSKTEWENVMIDCFVAGV